MHRTAHKKSTKASKILRYMRMSKGMTQRKAAAACSLCHALINHYEQGRLDIPKHRLEQLVRLYGYTPEEFMAYLGDKPIPVLDLKDECVGLLDRIDEAKLRAVHAVLVGFVG